MGMGAAGLTGVLDQGPFPLPDAAPMRIWTSFDGTRGYKATYNAPDLDKPRQIHRGVEEHNLQFSFRNHLSPAHSLGFRVWGIDLTLLELLRSEHTRLVGYETLRGRRCVKVALDSSKFTDVLSVAGWFDAEADLHLCKLRMDLKTSETHRSSQFLGEAGFYYVLEFREFRSVPDYQSGQTRSVLHLVTLDAPHGITRMVLTEVALNTSIPRNRFVPEPQAGTEIVDGPLVAGTSRKTSIFGGAKAVDELVQRRLAEARQLKYPIPPGAEEVNAQVGASFSWAWIFLFGSLALLGSVLMWRFRYGSA